MSENNRPAKRITIFLAPDTCRCIQKEKNDILISVYGEARRTVRTASQHNGFLAGQQVQVLKLNNHIEANLYMILNYFYILL